MHYSSEEAGSSNDAFVGDRSCVDVSCQRLVVSHPYQAVGRRLTLVVMEM
jgi:hypothetical protein